MGVLGGSLKRKERLSARLGDVLSHLYLASATLKRYDEQGRIKEDLPFLEWAMQDCLSKMDIAIDDFIRNFPSLPVSLFLRTIVQPYGQVNDKPSDKVEHKIARILQKPGSARDRLGNGQYLTRIEGSLFGDLEQTLENMVKAEPIFDKICSKLNKKLPMTQLDQLATLALDKGIINEQEAELLTQTEAGRLRTINVDDFDPQELLAANSNKVAKPARKRVVKATKDRKDSKDMKETTVTKSAKVAKKVAKPMQSAKDTKAPKDTA